MADLSAQPPRLRLLVIDKGFSKETLAKFARSYVDCIVAEVPEPADDLLRGVEACEILIRKEKPDIIAASSRGGRVVAQLRANGCKGK